MILRGFEMHRECTKFQKRRDAVLVMLGVCTGDGRGGSPVGPPFHVLTYNTALNCMRVAEYGVQLLMYR